MNTNESSAQAELDSKHLSQSSRSATKSVAVFLSSATKVDRVYFDAARAVGQAIARQGWRLVYGGNYVGCMASVADGAREMGGQVVGITPQYFVDEGVADTLCDELIVTDTMRERKRLLEKHADAFVTLPGGLGTFEEFFEIVVGRHLRYHDKPIILLNLNDYYSPLLRLIETGVEQHFVRPEARKAFAVATNVEEMVELLRSP